MRTLNMLQVCFCCAWITMCCNMAFPGFHFYTYKLLQVSLTTILICYTAVDAIRRKVSP